MDIFKHYEENKDNIDKLIREKVFLATLNKPEILHIMNHTKERQVMLDSMEKGTPPKDSKEYLVFNGEFHIVTYWTSQEIYSHGGNREKGGFLDREGFRVEDIQFYGELKK